MLSSRCSINSQVNECSVPSFPSFRLKIMSAPSLVVPLLLSPCCPSTQFASCTFRIGDNVFRAFPYITVPAPPCASPQLQAVNRGEVNVVNYPGPAFDLPPRDVARNRNQ